MPELFEARSIPLGVLGSLRMCVCVFVTHTHTHTHTHIHATHTQHTHNTLRDGVLEGTVAGGVLEGCSLSVMVVYFKGLPNFDALCYGI
jgi:hypothetical protein